MDVINSLLTCIESFWGFLDSWTLLRLSPILGEISFLDFTFASYVVSFCLWFAFGFNGGVDDV